MMQLFRVMLVKLRIYNIITKRTVRIRTFKQQYGPRILRGTYECQVTCMTATLCSIRNKVVGQKKHKAKLSCPRH